MAAPSDFFFSSQIEPVAPVIAVRCLV